MNLRPFYRSAHVKTFKMFLSPVIANQDSRMSLPFKYKNQARVSLIGGLCLFIGSVGGCTSTPDSVADSVIPADERIATARVSEPPAPTPATEPSLSKSREPARSEPFSVEERMSFGKTTGKGTRGTIKPQLFSFRAQDMPLADALRLFSRVNSLNIVVGPDIKGNVTVDFKGLSLEKAMAALLDAHGFYWDKEEDLILVRRMETRTFALDYIRLARSGTGRNKAQITSGSGGGQDAGEVTLSQQDQIKFWEELEAQIKALLSTDGRMVVNRLSGTIQVTDLHRRVKDVAAFLSGVRESLYRQVEIQARIYEIILSDDYSLGLDWNRINFDGTAGDITLSNIITAPIGGLTAKAATAALSFTQGSFDGVIQALQEQGEVKVLSQPRILTMNNQPALIKVGTDQSFFSSTVTQGTAGTGNIITQQIRTVTEGLVLSVTPQISQDGWIMMDVTPIITRLEGTEVSDSGSTAPVLSVKQTGGLVRVRNGEMVIIGGLIQDQLSNTERKVPLLGDIPYLGRLFKGTYQARQKTELVIFIVPRIVKVL